MYRSLAVILEEPGTLKTRWRVLSWGLAFGIGVPGWLLLCVTLTLGRTSVTTISREWLISFFAACVATGGWYLLVYALLRMTSDLHGTAALVRCLATAAPMLLAVPLLLASYGSESVFHYLFANPIPRSLVQWSPPLLALLCQEALLIWSARIPTGWREKLLGPRAVPILLFASLVVLYVSSAGGHLYSPDEVLMYSVTENLVERGSVAIPNDGYAMAKGASAYSYSKYGLVPSLLAVPAYWVSAALGLDPDPQSLAFPLVNDAYPLVCLLVNPLVTAATCVLVFLVARRLGFQPASSLATALLYGAGTSAWVYSKTFFTQPPAALFLLAALYFLLRSDLPSGVEAGLAGVCFGLALGSRVELAVLAAPAAVLLARPFKRDRIAGTRALVAFALCLALSAGVVLGWYNWTKTGSVLMSGHGGQGTPSAFLHEPYIGVFGTLFSPGFSLILYNPVVLLGMLSSLLLVLVRRTEAYLFAGMLVLSVLFYGSFQDWFGGFTWADRYLVVMLPYAVIPVAVLLERPWRSGLSLTCVGVAALLGIAINTLGVLFDYNNGWLDLWAHQANLDLIAWNPHFSPIAAHLRLLRDYLFTGAKLDLYLYYKLGLPSLLASSVLFTGLLTLAARAVLSAKDERLGAVTGVD